MQISADVMGKAPICGCSGLGFRIEVSTDTVPYPQNGNGQMHVRQPYSSRRVDMALVRWWALGRGLSIVIKLL